MDVSQEFIQRWHGDSVPMMKSSGDAITEYLRHAKTTIDAIFGDGYAIRNPVLVGQVVLACNDSLSSANFNHSLLAIDAN